MLNTYYTNKNVDFTALLANFLTTVNSNPVPLEHIAGYLTPIFTLLLTYSTNLNNIKAN